MCGICGAFGKKINTEKVYAMGTAIKHRGPDGEGYFETVTSKDAAVILHSVRLAIVDKEGGIQPMHDGHVHVVYNGEIYNYRELRTTLQELGYCFETDSDTEVILKLYQEYGIDCVRFLRGMFAIALYDDTEETLYLWRDRFGVKPLFYKETEEGLWFASEIRGILAYGDGNSEEFNVCEKPDGNKESDMYGRIEICKATEAYLQYHSPVAPYTVYAGIFELEPGSEVKVSQDGLAKRRYYELSFAPSKPGKDISALEYALDYDECDAMAELRSHIYKAVGTRLTKDEPTGILLSGGLDSSYLAALAAGMHYAPIYTHTLCFHCEARGAEGKYEDVETAEYLAKKLGTFHTTYTITGQEALESLPKVVKAFDQPYSGGISLYWLMERVPEEHRIFLSGDGADEAFWGYPFHSVVYDRLHGGMIGAKEPLQLPGMPMSFWQMLLTEDMGSKIRQCGDEIDNAESFKCQEPEQLAGCVNRHYYEVLLPGQVLRYIDTLSMVFGKEIRSPFMDQRVVEYVKELPVWMKMRNGDRKYLLKRVASDILPSKVCNRKKETFLPPIALWMRQEWKEYILDMLSYEQIERRGHFKPEMVQYLLHQFYGDADGQGQTAEIIWSILMYELWAQSH